MHFYPLSILGYQGDGDGRCLLVRLCNQRCCLMEPEKGRKTFTPSHAAKWVTGRCCDDSGVISVKKAEDIHACHACIVVGCLDCKFRCMLDVARR